jgi:hypothetical protein
MLGSVHEIHTAIEIDATPEAVWSVLVDFASYEQWNPFIRSLQGTALAGSPLIVRIQPSGASAMTFRPTVLIADPPREIRWLGKLFIRGLFDGEHAFVIRELPGGRSRFEQSERFTGLLVALLRRALDRDTKRGFEAMNLALKQRAEQRQVG